MTQSLGAPSSCRSLARRQKAATRTWRPTPLKGPSSHTTALHAPRTTLPAAAQESAKGVVLSAGAQPPERDGQPTSAEIAKTWCPGAGGREHRSRWVVQDGPPCFTEAARAGPAGGMGCAAVPRNWARLPHLPFFYCTVPARRLRAPPSAKAWATLRREKHEPGAYGRPPDSHSPAPPDPDPRAVSSGDAKSTGDRKLQCPHPMPFCRLTRLLSQLRKCKVSWKKTWWLRASGAETSSRRNLAAEAEALTEARKMELRRRTAAFKCEQLGGCVQKTWSPDETCVSLLCVLSIDIVISTVNV